MDRSRQAPLSMGFSRQEYWSGLPFPSPGDLPNSDQIYLPLHCRRISSRPPGTLLSHYPNPQQVIGSFQFSGASMGKFIPLLWNSPSNAWRHLPCPSCLPQGGIPAASGLPEPSTCLQTQSLPVFVLGCLLFLSLSSLYSLAFSLHSTDSLCTIHCDFWPTEVFVCASWCQGSVLMLFASQYFWILLWILLWTFSNLTVCFIISKYMGIVALSYYYKFLIQLFAVREHGVYNADCMKLVGS